MKKPGFTVKRDAYMLLCDMMCDYQKKISVLDIILI